MRDNTHAATRLDLTLSDGPDSLRTLIDSIPALVAYIDCNMILQYCNQPFKECFALNREAGGESFPRIVGEKVFDQVQKNMGTVLVGIRAHFEIVITTAGGLQYFDATLSPDFDHRKKVKGFIFHCTDVTEQNRTQRALKDYFENATIGLHWVNAEGIIIWANPSELNLLGYNEHEYIGRHISEFHADKEIICDILNRLNRKEALRNYEADMLCKDGSIKHVAINSSVLWEGDKFIHTRCFTIDITEQKLAAKAVRESEARFRQMANLAPLIIWTTDDEGNCNFLSERWQDVTGQTIDQGLGLNWINFIHPEDRENIRQSWMKSLSKTKPFQAKFRLADAKGNYRITYANASPRHNTSEKFEGYIGIFQDISTEEHIRSSLEKIVLNRTEDLRKRNADLKQAEKALLDKNEELEKINKQLSSFAHIASHDLQEPLRKIQTFSNRLFELEGHKFSQKGKEFYYRIHNSSGRMKNLIHDLLTYSQSNERAGKAEYVDLNLLVDEVQNELELKITEKKATIVNTGLPTLHVIRFQFHQLFLNLLNNALKFNRPGVDPFIQLQSGIIEGTKVLNGLGELEKLYHHISITDNGIGFEPQFSAHIFEMFRRLHSRTEYEGTGIGLAICKKIVENHNGIIIAEGRINIGATFHIYLPAENT